MTIAGSAVLIPVFWEKYFQLLHDCCSCKLWLEVLYSSAALLIPVAALLIAAGPPEWGGALGLRARYVAAAYVSAALPIVALRLRWNWWCERQTASPREQSRCATRP